MNDKPIPEKSISHLFLSKDQIPQEANIADWTEVMADRHIRTCWSVNIKNARFIAYAAELLSDHMAHVREEVTNRDGVRSIALKVSGRAHFTDLMMKFMIAEGMAKASEFKDVNQDDLTDIRSMSRLWLIFDTHVSLTNGFRQWKQGMTPAALKAFPAARLIRVRIVNEPRPRHQEFLGEVLLKTDPRWAEFHNAKEIGGFGVPWGPYGFRSGVSQEDVSRSEARKLGLDVKQVTPSDDARITDETSAIVAKMSPDIKAKLIAELRAGQKNLDAEAIGRGLPAHHAGART
jgi:hypothetical protein